jgi:hypothetical protein
MGKDDARTFDFRERVRKHPKDRHERNFHGTTVPEHKVRQRRDVHVPIKRDNRIERFRPKRSTPAQPTIDAGATKKKHIADRPDAQKADRWEIKKLRKKPERIARKQDRMTGTNQKIETRSRMKRETDAQIYRDRSQARREWKAENPISGSRAMHSEPARSHQDRIVREVPRRGIPQQVPERRVDAPARAENDGHAFTQRRVESHGGMRSSHARGIPSRSFGRRR